MIIINDSQSSFMYFIDHGKGQQLKRNVIYKLVSNFLSSVLIKFNILTRALLEFIEGSDIFKCITRNALVP